MEISTAVGAFGCALIGAAMGVGSILVSYGRTTATYCSKDALNRTQDEIHKTIDATKEAIMAYMEGYVRKEVLGIHLASQKETSERIERDLKDFKREFVRGLGELQRAINYRNTQNNTRDEWSNPNDTPSQQPDR